MVYHLKTPPIVVDKDDKPKARLKKARHRSDEAERSLKTVLETATTAPLGQKQSTEAKIAAAKTRVIGYKKKVAELESIEAKAIYYKQARLIKIHSPGPAPEGGKRGEVIGFSAASRRRLMDEMAKLRRNAKPPLFVTLTYPVPPSGDAKNVCDQCRYHLRQWLKAVEKRWKISGFWRAEVQPSRRWKRNEYAPHFHLLLWVNDFLPVLEIQRLWNQTIRQNAPNSLDLEVLKSQKGAMSYASKYLAKPENIEKTMEETGLSKKEVMNGLMIYGRSWGIHRREEMPYGQEVVERINIDEAEDLIWGIQDVHESHGRPPDQDPHKKPRKLYVDKPEEMESIIKASDKRLAFKKTYEKALKNINAGISEGSVVETIHDHNAEEKRGSRTKAVLARHNIKQP